MKINKLTLDEAIKYCLEVSEQNEKRAEYRPRMDYYDELESRAIDSFGCVAFYFHEKITIIFKVLDILFNCATNNGLNVKYRETIIHGISEII